MTAREWLGAWFKRKGRVPAETADYFEAGLLDSLAAVELVAAIEKEFSVRFTDAHYQEARFATIAGLSELIEELQARG